MTIEKKEDITKGQGGFGKWNLWQKEIENAKKFRQKWDKEVSEYYDIYRSEASGQGFAKNRYPIFWANVQTLKPLIFSNLPSADVRRRHAGKDPIARLASLMLERAVNIFLENSDATTPLTNARDDGLIAGLGVIKVRLEQEITTTENFGEVAGEKEIFYDFFDRNEYLSSPAKQESKVRWRAFIHKMDRKKLVKTFGSTKGNAVVLEETVLTNLDNNNQDEIESQTFKRAEVYEIWDKTDKKVIFWSNGYKQGLLSEQDDIYNLKNFFPGPTPLNMGAVNGSILPVPPYRNYKSQAEELNEVTDRITGITKQITAGGLFAASLGQNIADALLNNGDGVFTPANTGIEIDLNKLIYQKDLTTLGQVSTSLRVHKKELIQEIQDITGISDIVRGTTQASETATAQQLKSNFAISRIQTQQQEMSNFIRDTIRITAELIAENFTGVELAEMAGIKVLKQGELDKRISDEILRRELKGEEATKAVQIMREEQDRTIKIENAATDQTLTQVEDLLRSDKLRGFAIDVESETTVKADNDKLKAERAQFSDQLTRTILEYMPLVQQGLMPLELLHAIIQFMIGPHKVGRQLEESIEQIGQTPPDDEQQEEGPSEAEVEAQKAEVEAQQNNRKMDIDEKKVDGEILLGVAKLEQESENQDIKSSDTLAIEEIRAIAKQSNQGALN